MGLKRYRILMLIQKSKGIDVQMRRLAFGLKVHKIEIFFGFEFEICIISLLVMSKY